MWISVAITTLALMFVSLATPAPLDTDDLLLAVNIFYGMFLILTWRAMALSTPADVRRWALAQETPRNRWWRLWDIISSRKTFSGDAGMFVIQSISAGGVVIALTLLPRGEGLEADPLRTLLCGLGVLLSWALLHTSYAMFYAHLYYHIPRKPGGLEFPGEEEPAALDFAYFAFAIGTTFATSDVSVSSGKVRRTVLSQSILAFFYNTTILGLVVNLIITGTG